MPKCTVFTTHSYINIIVRVGCNFETVPPNIFCIVPVIMVHRYISPSHYCDTKSNLYTETHKANTGLYVDTLENCIHPRAPDDRKHFHIPMNPNEKRNEEENKCIRRDGAVCCASREMCCTDFNNGIIIGFKYLQYTEGFFVVVGCDAISTPT